VVNEGGAGVNELAKVICGTRSGKDIGRKEGRIVAEETDRLAMEVALEMEVISTC
jgi:hypothetical protein